VRNHRRDAGFVHAPPEGADIGRIERLAFPLARVLAEDLQRLAPVEDGALDRLGDAAGDGHVGPDAHPFTVAAASRKHAAAYAGRLTTSARRGGPP
jgi:hypothetical protein